MWKLLVAFILFAAVGLYVLKKSGADIDMSGEKHGVESSHATPGSGASAALPASAASN